MVYVGRKINNHKILMHSDENVLSNAIVLFVRPSQAWRIALWMWLDVASTVDTNIAEDYYCLRYSCSASFLLSSAYITCF